MRRGGEPHAAIRRATRLVCGLALGFVISSAVASAERIEQLRTHIRQRLADTGTASVAVAVTHNSKIIWEEGFGWADRERRIAASEHTMYSLASVTKPLTVTGILVLAEKGLLDLDRPINDYLGAAKLTARIGDARDATVRRVVVHRAGLPVHAQHFFADEPYPLPSMDEMILRYGNLVAIPDERMIYSNMGYGLLGYIIARVSGQSYADFMRREVFLKLGMTHTSVYVAPGLESYQATRYETDGSPIPFYRIPTPGSADVYSSAHDLALFGMFHLKNRLPEQARILSDASIDEQRRLGSISKRGGMPGVATVVQVVPAADMVIVVLANGSWFGPEDRTIKPDEIAARIQKVLAPEVRNDYLPVPAKQPAPVASLVGTWAGTLHTELAELPLTLQIMDSGDVKMQLADQLQTLLNEVRFEDFWLEGVTSGDVRTPDASRHGPYRIKLMLKQRGADLQGSAVTSSEFLHPPRGDTLAYWVQLHKK